MLHDKMVENVKQCQKLWDEVERIPLEKGGTGWPARGHPEMSNLMDVMKKDMDILMDKVVILEQQNKELEAHADEVRKKESTLRDNAEDYKF